METASNQEDPMWNAHMLQPLEHVQTRSTSPKSEPTFRHESSAISDSSRSTSARRPSAESRGRRSQPSVVASQAPVAPLQEIRERRDDREFSEQSTLTWNTRQQKSSLTPGDTPTEKVISSRDVLKSFDKVATRNVEKDRARQTRIDRYDEEHANQRQVYNRLVKWANTRQATWTEYLLSFLLPCFRQAQSPDDEELKSLARHYYTPRSEVKVHICDFGLGRSEHHVVDLGRVEDFFNEKPDWVDVRWIHAPLGLGLMHSTIEDIFLYAGDEGRRFLHSGRSGWGHPEAEVFNFVDRAYLQEMRDVYLLLQDRKSLQTDLDASTWRADRNKKVRPDIEWRSGHLAVDATFWNLANSDMPWQLSEGLSMGSYGPKDGLKPVSRHVEKQTLSLFDFYRDAHLVRDPFRTFHRGDGFLLTLSPMVGVNYLDKDFSRHMKEPIDHRFSNDDSSAIGHCFEAFAETGTSSWHRRTVEFLLTYILTEVCVTPNAMRQGYNAPELNSAYSCVIQDLKRRRFDRFERKDTVELVRQYLACIDEVTCMTLSLKKRLDMFEAMLVDIKRFEGEDLQMGNTPHNPEGESPIERIDWAKKLLTEQSEAFERLLVDLRQSLDALFQLRSIEQNELAIASDSQNKAILVFTGVTTIFLPLSFFTSYFGMNLNGISDSHENQSYFWKVCGTVAFIIVLVVTVTAFSHHIRRASLNRQQRTRLGGGS